MQEWSYLNTVFHRDLRAQSCGMPVQIVPLIIYSDDTSGNRSKKWNKFDVWAMMLAGLPKTENSKLENIHLIAASNLLSAVDMSEEIVKDLNQLEKGIVMYDSYMKQNALVLAPVICFICDNVRASELVNHMGHTANRFCRICQVKYTYWLTQAHQPFLQCDKSVDPAEVGIKRTSHISAQQMNRIRRAKTSAEKISLRTLYGLKENDNPLLKLDIDLHQLSNHSNYSPMITCYMQEHSH